MKLKDNLVSIDPGLRACGVAVWSDGVLIGASLVKGIATGDNIADLCSSVAIQTKTWAASVLKYDLYHLLVEFPQTYRGAAARGDTNDLLALATVAGALVSGRSHRTSSFVLPHAWKGNMPKDVLLNRIKKKLTAEELTAVQLPTAKSLQHNVWDAIGIGLHNWGR